MKLLIHIIVVVLLMTVQVWSTVFTVTNINDTGPGSLRDAINRANSLAGPDTILFQIPNPGVQTISPLSPLPPLLDTQGLLMDGFSQPGSSPGSNPPSTAILLIEIDGSKAGSAHGLWILSPHNIVRGLVINNFHRDGIRIEGTESGTFKNHIFCNFVGTDPTGKVRRGNGRDKTSLWAGIYIIVTPDNVARYAYDNTLEANLSSDNYAEGVGIANCPPGDVYNNVVLSNYVGTDITGMIDLGNVHTGVYIGEGAHDNIVANNLISGNDCEGVCIVGWAEAFIPTYGNQVLQNLIGLDANKKPLPNTREGVNMGEYFGTQYKGGYAPDNTIGPDNIIAHNGLAGVSVWEHPNTNWNADGNLITQNSIYTNGKLGIDLNNDAITMNDAGDPDGGPNQRLNYPVINQADYTFGQTLVSGKIDIDSDPTKAVVEVFKAKADPSDYGEGAIYLGAATPDAAGNWSVVLTGLAPGDSVTATTSDQNSNTSEFGKNVVVIIATDVPGYDSEALALDFAVFQNYPNPFNAETHIFYRIPRQERVVLRLFNSLGERIATLVNGVQKPGMHQIRWNGCDGTGRALPSGIYFCRVQAGWNAEMKKLMLLR